jgi:hypothetical protein
MKTTGSVAFLSLAVCWAWSAPAQTLEWTRQLGTTDNEDCEGLSADGLGNVYISGGISGSLGGPNAGESDAFVAKYTVAPEPATWLMLLLALATLLLRRHAVAS